ncbi:NAD(P)/FAD-dependent oxidoreductase [Marinobacter sediminicola]|uniref:NAD(P)/FAD-dependent oxidoreductase n=1 Tax=Marinobacter sediminicola TaxID=3072994 RepID=UPI002810C34D|nr:FAD-dependent oxidoreductase [Marinobacter sp. F26243]
MIRKMEPTLIVCGHGMVAQRFLEELVSKASIPYRNIIVFNGETYAAYNRVQLSALLSGDTQEDSLPLKPDAWFAHHGIQVHHGEAVEAIAPDEHTVTTSSGRVYSYSTLVIATGASPARLGIPGEELSGVMNFRDLNHTRTLIELSKSRKRAIVVGGGFLGLEAAEGLLRRGMDVTVLHRSRHLLNRQLDPDSGKLLSDALTERGMHILTSTSPSRILGQERVRAIQLHDQTLISTDLVVIATGIKPNRELAQNAGLACGRGIQVNAQLQTSAADIFAIGECCEFNGETYGLVEPGYQHAKTLACVLAGTTRSATYQPSEIATRLKIGGIPVFSCCKQAPDEHTESLIWQDITTGGYNHLLVRDNRLVGAILMGNTSQGPWYQELINDNTDIQPFRAQLPFGKPYCEAAA